MSSVFVTLVGGTPWGFRIQGGRGTGHPLTLSKVSPGGRGWIGGLREGDVLRGVGGRPTDGLSQSDIKRMIEDAGNTLTLHLHRKAENEKTFKASTYNGHSTFEKGIGSNGNAFEFHPPPTATTYQLNGGSRSNGFGGIHSPTIVTDMAPPPGAVLLEERVSHDEGAGLRHTDRLYGLPIKEVTKETTSTAHFRPAPPKYEGIGPCEDGLPLAPRNSVKKENMHNWYKTMFKSLHKTDIPNDNQEYVIGYSSEPETSKKDRTPRKKSSTLDHRNYVVKGKDYSRPTYEARPRLIEDFEPGQSSVTDNDITVGYKRYLPALNTPKPSYEYTKGYEPDCRYIRNLSPDHSPNRHQEAHYVEVQRGGEVPRYGLGKPAPDKHADPVVGPLPPPPINYSGPVVSPQATRPLNLPANYQTGDDGLCQQSNGAYEMHMRNVIHSELQHRISPASSQLSSPTRSTTVKSPSRSPDLKMPARALFDFKAESLKEIPLKKDDAVLISRQLDRNWYEGECRGRHGIFPVAYVEIVPPEHAPSPKSSEGSARLLYDFTAHTPVELSARKGDCVALLRRVDANWYEAKLCGRKGIVPSSYLNVTHEPTEKSSLSPSPQPCLRSPCGSEPKDRRSPTRISPLPVMSNGSKAKVQSRTKNLIEPVMYRALYSYTPLHSDELELKEGDSVCVVERCDDGWFVGTAAGSGRFGIFPGNYVQRDDAGEKDN